jgi:hypothetical protein
MTQDEMEQMFQALGSATIQLTQVAIAQQAFNAQMVEQTGLLTRALSRIEARLQSMDETLKGLLPQRRTNGGTQNA